MITNKLILASSSPQRQKMLNQIGIIPYKIVPANITEDLRYKETAKNYVLRVAKEKALKVAEEYPDNFILSGDTIVAKGPKFFFKPKNKIEAYQTLKFLSGKRHKVFSAISIINPKKKIYSKISITTIKFSNINENELNEYLSLNEWKGKAGSYALQGFGAKFIQWIHGSASGVIGLPLYELKNLLVTSGWKNNKNE